MNSLIIIISVALILGILYMIFRVGSLIPALFQENSIPMSDRTLTCRDCGQAFTFTAGEQAFYSERGYSEPLRCPSCRASRKQQRSSGGDSYGGGGGYSSGGGYGGDSYSSGRSGGGGYGGGGDSYNRGPRQMYPAVCSQCGKETEVPFQPTAGKPVYCQDCFRENRRSSSSYGSRY